MLSITPRGRKVDAFAGTTRIVAGRAGQNNLSFSGRVGGRRLAPGRYQLVVTPLAVDAPKLAYFTIRK